MLTSYSWCFLSVLTLLLWHCWVPCAVSKPLCGGTAPSEQFHCCFPVLLCLPGKNRSKSSQLNPAGSVSAGEISGSCCLQLSDCSLQRVHPVLSCSLCCLCWGWIKGLSQALNSNSWEWDFLLCCCSCWAGCVHQTSRGDVGETTSYTGWWQISMSQSL